MEDRQAPVGQTNRLPSKRATGARDEAREAKASRKEATKALEAAGFAVRTPNPGQFKPKVKFYPGVPEESQRQFMEVMYYKKVELSHVFKAVDLLIAESKIKLSSEARSELADLFQAAVNTVIKKDDMRDFRASLEKSEGKNVVLPTEIAEDQKYAAWSKINERSIATFLEKGWPAPFIKAGLLTRPALFNLDRSAYKALTNYLERGNALPAQLSLPTRSAVVTEQLNHVDREALREAQRLASAAHRRRQQVE